MVHNPPRASRIRHHLNSPIGDARATRSRATPQKDRWPASSQASLNIFKNGGAVLSAERQEHRYPAFRTCRSNVSAGLYQRQGTRASWCRSRTPLQLSPTQIRCTLPRKQHVEDNAPRTSAVVASLKYTDYNPAIHMGLLDGYIHTPDDPRPQYKRTAMWRLPHIGHNYLYCSSRIGYQCKSAHRDGSSNILRINMGGVRH